MQPHLAADNLELIRDEDGNNLLHISASQGHADCLQHLTSLMGEDCLNERNNQQLTPAGLGVKVNFSVRLGVCLQSNMLVLKCWQRFCFNDIEKTTLNYIKPEYWHPTVWCVQGHPAVLAFSGVIMHVTHINCSILFVR